jgi:hypothetical protein
VGANLQGRVGDIANEEKIRTTATEKEKERVRARATRRPAAASGGAGAKTKTTTTEAAVEATAIAGGVDTLAATTVTTATIVMATTMTRLNVCDALTEEKSVRQICCGRMQQSNRQECESREGRKTVAGAEECGAGAGKDLEDEKGDNTTTNNGNDRQHTTIKQNMAEVGGRRRRWRRR